MANPATGVNKIVLKAGFTDGAAEHEEGILKGAASPGMNVVMNAEFSSQGRDRWQAGGSDYAGTGTDSTTTKAPLRILKEDSLRGLTIDDAFEDGDNIFIHIAKPGDVLNLLCLSGENFNKGELASAAASGKFVADATNGAVECIEDRGSGGALAADTHLRFRVL